MAGQAGKDYIIFQIEEMFGSVFDSDTIKCVMESCNGNLEDCIESLITLSITEEPSSVNNKSTTQFVDLGINNSNISAQGNKNGNVLKNNSSKVKHGEWTTIKKRSNCTPNKSSSSSSCMSVTSPELLENNRAIRGFTKHGTVKKKTSSPAVNNRSNPENVQQWTVNSYEIVGKVDEAGDIPACSGRPNFQRSDQSTASQGTLSAPQRQENPYDVAYKKVLESVEKGYKVIILLRGPPGCGKSCFAKNIVRCTVGGNPANYVYSSDDYFVHLGRGRYQFDPSRLQEAHGWNQTRALSSMRAGRSPIIIDNTNTKLWEMQPYAAIAVSYGYIVEILEPRTPWASDVHKLAEKNGHGVPKAKIRQMIERFEKIDNGWALLRYFRLDYNPLMKMPQFRLIPPINHPLFTVDSPPVQSNVYLPPQKQNVSPNPTKDKQVTSETFDSDCDRQKITTVPIDSQSNPTDSACCAEKVEKSTNTCDEDFNFVHVVVSTMLDYKILPTIGRDINEGLSSRKSEIPNSKLELMRHKSCSTEQFISDKDFAIQLDEANEAEDSIAKLKGMFTDISEDCLKQIYRQCDCDCDRTVDFLLEEKEQFFFSEKCNIANEKEDLYGIDKDDVSEALQKKKRNTFRFLSESSNSSDEFTFLHAEDLEASPSRKNQRRKTYENGCRTDPDLLFDEFQTISHRSENDHTCADSTDLIDLQISNNIFRMLQHEFGTPEFTFPEGISPVVQIKRTWARILYELCVKSAQDQLDVEKKQLDQIEKDAEYAKLLEEQETQNENTARIKESLQENLHQIFPNFDEATLNQLLLVHNGDFEETINFVKTSTGQLNADGEIPNKNDEKIGKGFNDSEDLSYKDVLKAARQARKEARNYANLRNENIQKARNFCKKNPGVALYYTQMAQEHAKNMDKANATAASAYLAAQTYVLDQENILDLHNLYLTEAMQALNIFLDHHMKKLQEEDESSTTVYIITGWGAHSTNGYSKIKEAVTKKLSTNNIRFINDNPGRFKVTLDRTTLYEKD